jgi:hypothetical protein
MLGGPDRGCGLSVTSGKADHVVPGNEARCHVSVVGIGA